jgi:hypothetical protein
MDSFTTLPAFLPTVSPAPPLEEEQTLVAHELSVFNDGAPDDILALADMERESGSKFGLALCVVA